MSYLQPTQSTTTAPSPWEMKLAGAIEEVFGSGRHDLTGLVAGLNELGIPAPGGDAWTEATFTRAASDLAGPEGAGSDGAGSDGAGSDGAGSDGAGSDGAAGSDRVGSDGAMTGTKER